MSVVVYTSSIKYEVVQSNVMQTSLTSIRLESLLWSETRLLGKIVHECVDQSEGLKFYDFSHLSNKCRVKCIRQPSKQVHEYHAPYGCI
jgi:hypothetical protein